MLMPVKNEKPINELEKPLEVCLNRIVSHVYS